MQITNHKQKKKHLTLSPSTQYTLTKNSAIPLTQRSFNGDISRVKSIFWCNKFSKCAVKNPERQRYTKKSRDRRFRGCLRTDAHSFTVTWTKMEIHGILRTLQKEHPVHLLWWLFRINSYATELILCSKIGGVDWPIFLKWSWFYVERISTISSETVSSSFVSLWNICLCIYIYIFVCINKLHISHICRSILEFCFGWHKYISCVHK